MPSQPQAQPASKSRATRYKAPEPTPQELALLDWFNKLPHEEQLALRIYLKTLNES